MIELKCPFCQQELKKHFGGDMPEVWCCDNKKCKLQTIGGDIELWQELIRTHKALAVAAKKAEALKELADIAGFGVVSAGCQDIIEQTTALEQKEG